MANEISGEDGAEPVATSANHLGRHVLVAGIAGACLLGVGAGLWARPAAEDQRTAAVTPKYVAKPAQKLEIVLADPLAPPPATAMTAAIAGPTVSAEMVEPTDLAPPPADPAPAVRPPPGLMKVQDVRPAEAVPLPAPKKLEKAKPEKPEVVKAKVEKKPRPKAKKDALKVAEAAKREKSKAKADIQLAKAADEAGLPAADETRKPARISRIKAVIAKPFKARPKADEAQVAKAEPEKAVKPKPKSKSKSKTAPEEIKLAKAEAPKAAKAKAASKRCVSSDPGAAIVCADPGLAAADRQLSRAYREAEAAGVPAWQLRQQQQRWLAARAAAAREAPWAVHDVYLARIAELHDMTRDARGDY